MIPQQNNTGMGQFPGQQWGGDSNNSNQAQQQPGAGTVNHQHQQVHQFQLQQMQQQLRSQAQILQRQQGNQPQQMMSSSVGMGMNQMAQPGQSMPSNASATNMMGQNANQMTQTGGINSNTANATFPGMQPAHSNGMQSQMMSASGGGPGFNSHQQAQAQAQVALYWNALQASGMSNPDQKMQQMQLQQMQKQSQNMTSAPGGGAPNNTNGANSQHGQILQLQQLQAASQRSDSQSGQGGAPTDNQAQLLLQQQNLIAQLQRQIQQQQQQQQQNQNRQQPNQLQQQPNVPQNQQQQQPIMPSNQTQNQQQHPNLLQSHTQQTQQQGEHAGNPMPSPNPMHQMGGLSSPAMKPQQGQKPSQQTPFPRNPSNNSSLGMMHGLMQQQHRQGDLAHQILQQNQLGSTSSLSNLAGQSHQSQPPGSSKPNEHINFQELFRNSSVQQSAAPTPSVPNTPLMGAVPSVNQNGNNTGTDTPAPTNANGSPAACSMGLASNTNDSSSVPASSQNTPQPNQQLIDATGRTPSTQPQTDSNNQTSLQQQQQQQQQQHQQLLMAQMWHQHHAQIAAIGNAGGAGEGGGLEHRVRQFQVMQHLQQLQQQKQNMDISAQGHQEGGNNSVQLQVEIPTENQSNSNASTGSGQGAPRRRKSRRASGREINDVLAGVSPTPIAPGAISSSGIVIASADASAGVVRSSDFVQLETDCVKSSDSIGEEGLDIEPQETALVGCFAGGWQSNSDLPERRRIIFSIIKVMEKLRPDANRRSQKLPLMAKKIEEHMYRSAQSKEEYTNPSSMKRRLHFIGRGIGLPDTGGEANGSDSADGDEMSPLPPSSTASQVPSIVTSSQQDRQLLMLMGLQSQGNVSQELLLQQLQQQQMRQNGQNQNSGAQQQQDSNQLDQQSATLNSVLSSSGLTLSQNSDSQGGIAEPNGSGPRSEKKKIILQQQQRRLLLLRHASKCDGGPSCRTRFCAQMVTLWKHMKKCRDKNCKVSHCLSSRCVLNHYRICKSEGLTASCEVCAPVMKHIRQEDDENGADASDNDPMDQLAVENEGELDDTHDPLDALSPPAEAENQGEKQTSNNVESVENAAAPVHQSGNQAQSTSPSAQNNRDVSNAQSEETSNQPIQAVAGTQNPQTQLGINLLNGVSNQQHLSPSAIQSLQEDFQKKHVILQQVQQQKAVLFGQCQSLQQQLMEARSPQQLQQLQKQQALFQQLKHQFDQQESVLKNEIQAQSLLLQQHLNHLASSASEPSQQSSEESKLPVCPTTAESSQDIAAKKIGASDSVETSKPERKKRNSKKTQSNGAKSSGKKLIKSKGRLKKEFNTDNQDPPLQLTATSESIDEKKRSSDKISSDTLDNDTEGPRPQKLQKQESSSKNGPESEDASKSISPKLPSPQGGVSSAENQSGANTPDNGSSLVSSMPTAAIEQHLDSLVTTGQLTSRRIARKCLPIVRKLCNHEHGWVFKDPVDPVELGLPDYFEIVQHPMDLALVEKKLENGVYKDIESFERDTKLVFENAILFNGEDSDVGAMAKELLELFEEDLKSAVKGMKIEKEVHKKKGDACSLCGNHRRLFEPTIFYCSGACGSKIKRNATYYTDRSKQNQWCDRCYGSLDDNDPIQLDNGKETKKSSLMRLKNDATPEETWVQCDECHDWVHQICALFNGRQNVKSSSFTCPRCHVKSSACTGDKKEKPCLKNFKDAFALPQCKLSLSIEAGLTQALLKAYEKVAHDRGCTVAQVEKADGLCVRVVSSLEKKHVVREGMFSRYSKKNYPSEFPVRSKCILLFQKIHGVDVLLFGMYVYEYGHKCPAPNQRRVYISYLDSVRYLEPSSYRTIIYQTIIVEYLRHVKMRGFHTAHIWSCPPSKGDEYIFYCHPMQQLTPRDDMLCAWYTETLNKAMEEGIVLETRTLYDEYFKNDNTDIKEDGVFDPTSLPYFEGDYIPGEIENIIKDLSREESKREESKQSDTHKKSMLANTEKKEGKRLGTRSNPGALVNQARDKVMMRLDLALTRMKQNFIVAHLLSDDFVSAVKNGVDVSSWTDESASVDSKSNNGKIPGDPQVSTMGKKRNEKSVEKSSVSLKVWNITGDTKDDDPIMEQECLDTRLQFLNYCQKNNFQFDELRRAKHTTMMLLCHLHNPRTEREQQIRVHLEVIAHAATCSGPPSCVSTNCLKMKQLFEHVKGCDVTFKGGCKLCVRLFMLLTKHARDCTSSGHCVIPFCDRIRERNKRLLKQQQQMDDRRRNAQNDRHKLDDI